MRERWERKLEAFRASMELALGGEAPEEVGEILETASGVGIPRFPAPEEARETIHPVSGQRRPLEMDPERVRERILAVVRKLSADDPRRAFLRLWRELPEEVPEVLEAPAHFGQPCYSLFEAASVASAMAGAWPEPALVLFTVGGVQEYLVSSRRTQDFWMGSFLISWLSWQALRVGVERLGPDAVIMPHLWGQPLVDREIFKRDVSAEKMRVANLPNRFTLFAPVEEAEKLAREMEEALRRGLEEASEAVRTVLSRAGGGGVSAGALEVAERGLP